MKFQDQVGVIIGAYDRYAEEIGILAKQLKDAGLYVVIGYDAHEVMPSAEVVNNCDFFIAGGGAREKQYGHWYYILSGLQILATKKYKYVLSITGDALISKPKNIGSLVDILDDKDVITCHWRNQCGTNIFFGRTRELLQVYSDMPSGGRVQIEIKFRKALRRNRMDYTIYPCWTEDLGMWGKYIGFQRGNGNYKPPTGKLRY